MTSAAFITTSVLLSDVSTIIDPAPTTEEWESILRGDRTYRLRFLLKLANLISPTFPKDDNNLHPERLASFYKALGLHCEQRGTGEWPPMISRCEKRGDSDRSRRWLRQAIDLAIAAVKLRKSDAGDSGDNDSLREEIVGDGGLMKGVGVAGWKQSLGKKAREKTGMKKSKVVGENVGELVGKLKKEALQMNKEIDDAEKTDEAATFVVTNAEEYRGEFVTDFRDISEAVTATTASVRQVDGRLVQLSALRKTTNDDVAVAIQGPHGDSLARTLRSANDEQSTLSDMFEKLRIVKESVEILDYTLPAKKAIADAPHVGYVKEKLDEALRARHLAAMPISPT